MKANDRGGVTKIHNVRFYNLTPRSINCLAYNKWNGKLALSRGDASIEIWDMNHAPLLEKTIPGDVNSSVEALGWIEDRLFSAGLSGELVEWDLSLLEKKHSQFVTGNAIWCLDISKQQDCLALGTEEGYLNLFEVTETEVMYKLLFDKQEGRILCCKFDTTGDFIVTGSMDVIRIWSTRSGNAIHKMTMGRSEAKRETIVWSLQVLSDFSIISGDSRGQITIWDGKIGNQVQSIQASKADILALVVTEQENVIIAAGIDALIRTYDLTNVKKEEQITKMWIKSLQRDVHAHDVKALACDDCRIMSGGIDSYLGISPYKKVKDAVINKYGPFLQSPCASVSSEGRLLLLRYKEYLELWRLGIAENRAQINDDENDKRKILLLEEGPEKLIELRSYDDETVICSSISPNGCYLVYSTINVIRFFSLIRGNEKEACKLIRIKDLPKQFSPCSHIIFSQDSKTLFLVKLKHRIDVFKILTTDEIDYQETIDISKSIKDVIHLITISPCGKYLIVAGTCRTISVWIKSKKGWKHHINLPKYVVPTTAIAVQYTLPRLVATFSDGKIFEYDLEEMKFTCSSNEIFLKTMITHCINGIVLDPRNENIIILYNDNSLFVLSKEHESEKMKFKSKILKTEETAANIDKLKLKFVKNYEHLVHLDWLTEEELVIIGVNPVTLIEQLPAVFRRKKFGTS